ncbi:hypothetical protein AMIS_55760 [Actinoplanes missouriensis 431]|uniref:AAA domain-containing protein n=1 Tax=Actinoplanes missouriensis (strain ATCC 14538 / DSM 43046 / CBS 188.64 / JCM 3121 / NBRC 102363 / NCIMB 12654 / NRRL B-3342 / UNCC 431) TaxID=512565 RepID=I0HCQ9_ACTM4|nr:DUF3320 domain-containing protein [Actinoplanes missouriensis]BAL90796.1 hypothetical protein AMIS_55760 [Actinoplanes missouriensis 431]
MRWDDADGLTGRPDARVRGVLESWRAGLLDFTGSNPLIDVDPSGPGVVAIVSPTPRTIIEALHQGRECGFLGIEEQAEGPRPRAANVFQTEMIDADMDATLHALRRTARRDQYEQGISALYLALGSLHWQDGGQQFASPILLLPVELVCPDPLDYPRLRARPDDPIVNPALAVRLRAYGVELPAVNTIAGLDLTVFWARLDAAISEHPDWHSDEAVLLSRFDVQREVMYTDLVENERQILAHPVIRALATDPLAQPDALRFEPVPVRRIDELAAPDDVPLVLDADAAQRSAIAAAVDGRTFVLRGAPGTGKTQTVANMIACLIHAGKRVLLVSEKAAALDGVKERLGRVGLDDYLLELHSDRIGRLQVAATLAAALDFIPLPPPSLSTDEREELRQHRIRLNAYAEAMNEVREPLGHRLHDVLGMCAQMTDLPAGPVPSALPVPLTTQSLQRVRDAAASLGRAWRPALEGDDFLWRDVIDRNRLDARLHQAQAALEHLVEAVASDRLAAVFDAQALSDAITLTTLVGHAARRPAEVPGEWLTLDSLETVAKAAESLVTHLRSLHRAEEVVRAKAGVTWSALPSPAKLPVVPTLVHLNPPPVELLPLTSAQARGLARRFAEEADRLEQHQHSLDRVTARLGLPNVVAFTDIGRVAAIVDLLSRPDKPEPTWFDTTGMASARAAARVLQRAVDVVKAAESRAREHFNDAALVEPVDELAERFATQHKGMRKLRAPYRRDKRIAAGIARTDVKRSDAVANLAAAAAWKRSIRELEQAEQEYARNLGSHWRHLDTDFDAIQEALKTAEEALRITPPEALPGVIERVCAPTPNSAIIRIVTEARKEFDRFTAALRTPPEPAPRPQLAAGPIHDAVTWLRAHVEPLTAAADLVQAYSTAAGRDFTLAESAAIGLLRETASDAAAALTANAAEYADVLGPLYRGTQTDVDALAGAMSWASEARRVRAGADIAFTPEQAAALAEVRPTDALPSRVAEWQAARDWILRAFAPRRHPSLTATLDDHESARELITALLEDSHGQQEWFDYQAARAVLGEHGLDPVVEFCAHEDLPVDQLLPVLGRALFQSWADMIIREDERLPPLDAASRDRLIREFRLWDTLLERAAAADVMNAVDEMQPSGTAVAEAAVLRAAAAQQGRRPAVRDLLAETRNATFAVKPCMLTIPADVSRLIPSDLYFDVVIVDEASRVPVADAITCAYRASSMIVVGDDRQLGAAPLPGGDGQSILGLAIHCGAFPVLDLTTHYRSRHESLIAFANHSFYAGQLNTFPAAAPAGPDSGVQLYGADGDESLAEEVASRVAHHLVTRPDRTLGVVTCTPELRWEIEAAVADMVGSPDDDRLRGFFVKDLDAVQGDERDVMILAIGTDLGGLDGADGWRRLNVATTRAARRLEVVSSVRGRDLADRENVRHLAAYLDYAVRGEDALELTDPAADAQAPFEDSVRDVIAAWGYHVRTRVGTGAFRVDLAVRLSSRRSAPYVLGIECDGTTYDSAPAARDRDRLREQVLQGLGWRLHRIWGTAWYLDREHEEQRLRIAIDEALAEYPAEPAPELTGDESPVAEAAGEPVESQDPIESLESVEPLADDGLAEVFAEADAEEEAFAEAFAEVYAHTEPEVYAVTEPEVYAETEPEVYAVREPEPVESPEVTIEISAEQAAAAAGPVYQYDEPAGPEPWYLASDYLIDEAGAYLAGVEDAEREAVSFEGQPDVVAAVSDYEHVVVPAIFEQLHRAEIDPVDMHPVAGHEQPYEPEYHEQPQAEYPEPEHQEEPEPAEEEIPVAAHLSEQWAVPYQKAELEPLPAGAGLTDPDTRLQLIDAVRQLAQVEGPVHIAIALQRMREQWGLARITKQARAAIEESITDAGLAWDGTFLSDPGQLVPMVRFRAEDVARKADQIADAELRVALEHLVHDGGVLTVDQLLAATGRLYGWAARRSPEVDARLTTLIADLVDEGHLIHQADGLATAHGLPDATTLPHHEAAKGKKASRPRRSAASRK